MPDPESVLAVGTTQSAGGGVRGRAQNGADCAEAVAQAKVSSGATIHRVFTGSILAKLYTT